MSENYEKHEFTINQWDKTQSRMHRRMIMLEKREKKLQRILSN